MPKTVSRKSYIGGFGFLIIAGVAVYIVLPQIGNLHSSWQSLRQASLLLTFGAFIVSLAASLLSAVIYTLLSFKRLHIGDTILVELSGLFINRVLPAGIGGLGLNFLYLRAHRHSASQATAVITLNNSLGLIGHGLLAAVFIPLYLLQDEQSIPVKIHQHTLLIIAGVFVLCLLVVIILLRAKRLHRLQQRIRRQLHVFVTYYAARPRRILGALAVACLLTLCNVGSLWLSCQAIGISISYAAVFIIFTFGIAAGTATPTPGGIGGTEAALAAGLVAYHTSLSVALAAALLYRFVSFWLGLLIGMMAALVAHSRHLLTA